MTAHSAPNPTPSTASPSNPCRDNGNGRCDAHKGAAINGDSMCRVGRAWACASKPCAGCRTQLSPSQGMRVHPLIAIRYPLGQWEQPTVRGRDSQMVIRILRAMAADFAEAVAQGRSPVTGQIALCDACAPTFLGAINPGEHVGRINTRGYWLPLFVAVGRIPSIWNAIKAGVNELATRIAAGVTFERGHRRTEGERELNECTVHHVTPSACLCGGWHDWAKMPTLRQMTGSGDYFYYGFGPACADAIGRCGFEMGVTLKEAIGPKEIAPKVRPTRPEPTVLVTLANGRSLTPEELVRRGIHLRGMPRDEESGDASWDAAPTPEPRRAKSRAAEPISPEEAERRADQKKKARIARQTASKQKLADPHYGVAHDARPAAPAAQRGRKKRVKGGKKGDDANTEGRRQGARQKR